MLGPGGVVPMLGEVPHPPPGLPLPQYNMSEYMAQHAWPANIIPLNQPLEVSLLFILLQDFLQTSQLVLQSILTGSWD